MTPKPATAAYRDVYLNKHIVLLIATVFYIFFNRDEIKLTAAAHFGGSWITTG
jgi:hypothetical protein